MAQRDLGTLGTMTMRGMNAGLDLTSRLLSFIRSGVSCSCLRGGGHEGRNVTEARSPSENEHPAEL